MGSPQHDFCGTELGIGEHDKQELRLHRQRNREFQDSMMDSNQTGTLSQREHRSDARAQDLANSQMTSSSAACIGWSQADGYTEMKRLLNLERRAEYEAHMVKKDNEKQANRNERKEEQRQGEEEVEQFLLEQQGKPNETDLRHQKQQVYCQQLDDQIEMKRGLDSAKKMNRMEYHERKEQPKQEDEKNIETEGNGVLSEADVRHQKQQLYCQQLDDQIEQKRGLDLARKMNRAEFFRSERKEEPKQEEDEKNIATEGNGELSEADVRHQKQQDYAQQLREQIEAKRGLDLAKKKREREEDAAYNNYHG